MPFVVVAALLAAAGIGLGLVVRAPGARIGVAGVAVAMAAAAYAFARATPARAPSPSPVRVTEATEYVASSACLGCHPSEYASFRKTFHRTMTQIASRQTVAAPLDPPVTLALDGRAFGLFARGDAVWAAFPDGAPRRVELTTGSHNHQAFWTTEGAEGAPDRRFAMFPFVYLVRERRFVARRDAFLQPPGQDGPVHWENNCIACHATAGSPGYDESTGAYAPEVAELGVACEACHGPGGAHVRRYEDPVARYAAHLGPDRADPTIRNPSRLEDGRASMICGACHAYTFPRDEADFLAHGYAQRPRPGEDLSTGKILLTRALLDQPGAPRLDAPPEDLFYDDGTPRIGGREYNGLAMSACFLRGSGRTKLECTSCHSMHDAPPEGQVAPWAEGDRACAPCHAPARYATTGHTGHARLAGPSPGCVDCHMPRTSYALLKAIRSHRVDAPDVATLGGDRPNACNLCHLDRSEAWTRAQLLARGGGGATSPATTAVAGDASGAAWLLAGDPAQRALAAAALSEPGALAAVGDASFAASLLDAAANDPYAAVRFIAARSRAKLPPTRGGREVPAAAIDALVAARSDRALTLSE